MDGSERFFPLLFPVKKKKWCEMVSSLVFPRVRPDEKTVPSIADCGLFAEIFPRSLWNSSRISSQNKLMNFSRERKQRSSFPCLILSQAMLNLDEVNQARKTCSCILFCSTTRHEPNWCGTSEGNHL